MSKFALLFESRLTAGRTPITYVARVLGQGNSYMSIMTSAILSFISFFYLFTLGSFFKVNLYSLENRVTYSTFFDVYIINKYFDQIIIASGTILWLALSTRGKARYVIPAIYGGTTIAAISAGLDMLLEILVLMAFPIILSVLIYDRFVPNKILNDSRNVLYKNYLAIIGIVTGIVGIVISLAPFFSIPSNSIPIPNYSYDIFLFFSSFSPILILLLISSLPVKLFMKELVAAITKIKPNKWVDSSSSNNNNKSIKSTHKTIYLLLFILLSVFIAFIPHQPIINRDNQQIGVDTHFYVSWIDALMHSKDLQQFIQQAFVIQSQGDRPLTLIFLFSFAKIIPNVSLSDTFEYLPVILGPALVLVTYFLTRELTSNNDTAALLASFLTAISFQTLIGIYAGFYANWFALIIGYLSFVFLFKFLKTSSIVNLGVYSMLIVLLLLSHAYTWTILAIVTGIFLGVMLKLDYYRKKNVILLLLVLLSCVVIDVTRMSIAGSAGGIEQDIGFAQRGAGLEQFTLRWINLTNTIFSYVGGLFSNFIIFSLGLYWLFRSNLQDPNTIFLFVFLSIGLIAFLVGNLIIQTRVFYDIPFQIPAAIALACIRKQYNGALISLPICLWLIAITIRDVSSFSLALPS
jgi:hypothetical protein